MKTMKRIVSHRTRAVLDSESAGSSADSKNQSARPVDLKLRPAGVSDAVVDSQKALEALARLGGNRTCFVRRVRRVRGVFSTSRTWETRQGRLIAEDTAAWLIL